MKEQIIKILRKYFHYRGEIENVTTELELLIDAEVERRIAERMPTEEEIEKAFTTAHYHWEKGHYYKVRKDRIFGAKWFRSRMKEESK